jgi:hypothetical protein
VRWVKKETGDIDTSMMSILIHSTNADLVVYMDLMTRSRQVTWLALTTLQLQFVKNLTGNSDDPLELTCI